MGYNSYLHEKSDIVSLIKKYTKKNLGIPRKDMPQIRSDLVPEFLSELKKEGIKVTKKKVMVSKIYSTQKDFNVDKVEALMGKEISNLQKPVVISKDGYLLDGHHRWLALRLIDDMSDITANVVDIPIKELINKSKNFSKVEFKTVKENDMSDFKQYLKKEIDKKVHRVVKPIVTESVKNVKKDNVKDIIEDAKAMISTLKSLVEKCGGMVDEETKIDTAKVKQSAMEVAKEVFGDKLDMTKVDAMIKKAVSLAKDTEDAIGIFQSFFKENVEEKKDIIDESCVMSRAETILEGMSDDVDVVSEDRHIDTSDMSKLSTKDHAESLL